MKLSNGMTRHPITVYRHRADLSLYNRLVWITALEAITTNFNDFFIAQNEVAPSTLKSNTQSWCYVVRKPVGKHRQV